MVYQSANCGWLVGCFGFNGPLRQYFSLYWAVQTVTCKSQFFSDSRIMITPEPGTKADTNFRFPKQTATVYWVDSDI